MNKAKAFIKLLTTTGEVEYYSYRIEFQIRGMPHVHGVFWLKKEILEKFMTENQFDDAKVPELIDQWTSCSLDTGNDELNKLVAEVNVHRHTPSCKKGNSTCRFSFPRLPSNKTLIAGPPSSELSEDEKKKLLSKSKQILEKVKNKLINKGA